MACEYSTKFIPLIVAKAAEFQNNPEGLKIWFNDSFTNGSNLYNRYVSGTLFNERGASTPVKVENRPYYGRFNQDTTYDIISDYFKNASDLQVKAEYAFKNQIVQRIIFDRTQDDVDLRWKNPLGINNETGVSFVNEAIAKYKEDLVNAILSEVDPESKVTLSSDLSDSEFTKIIQDALTKYRQFLGTNPEVAEQYTSFVILSTFDEYLKAYAPFITPKSEYVNEALGKSKSIDSFNKYLYHGPTVQHYTGYTSSEFAAIENQDSDLAKLLLDTIPDLNEEGKEIEGSFIGLSGFNASIMAVKNWILYEAPREIRQELRKGNNADFSKIIDEYLLRKKNNDTSIKNFYSDTSTFLNGKLKSIKHFIFDENSDEIIKSMFTNMILKTEPVSYRTYSYDLETKQIKGSNLRSTFINTQKFNLEDLVRSTAYLVKTSQSYRNNLNSKYEFKSTNEGIEIIDLDNRDNRVTVYVNKPNNKGVEGGFIGNATDEFKKRLIQDLLLFIVPDTYIQVGQSMESDKNWVSNWANDFAPFIGVVANLMMGRSNAAITWDNNNMLNLKDYTKVTLNVAKKLSVIYGSETRNVVKNLSGSNLPMYQLTNLSYNISNVIDDIIDTQENISDEESDNFESYKKVANINNLLVQARELLIAPQVRQEVQYGDLIKPTSKLTVKELLELNVLHDFYEGFNSSPDSEAYGKVYLQSATYADKSTHYLFGYDLNKDIIVDGEKINLFEIIKKIVNGEGNSSRLMEITRNIRASRINTIISNIIGDYNKVFNTNFKSIEEVSNFLKGKNYKEIVNSFNDAGVEFLEEIHGTRPRYKDAPNIALNETMLEYYRTFNNSKLFEQRLNKAKASFIKSIDDNYWVWNRYDNPIFESIYKSKKYERFKGLNGNIQTHIGNQLHPILEAYFLTDVLLSNEINSLLIGEVWAHPNKNKRLTLTQEEYDKYKLQDPSFDEEVGTYTEFSEANRLIAQIKRSVAFGATYHPYLQNLDNGVPPEIRIAVIEDIPGIVFTPNGDQKTDLDSSDGSGIAHPLQSRFENNSLVDARVGRNKKSIMMDVDPYYGRPTLLKWAVYELSNENRRNGILSRANLENIYKKMSDGMLDIFEGELNDYLEDKPLYFKDYKSGKYYKILSFENTDENALNSDYDNTYETTRYIIEVDPKTLETVGPTIAQNMSLWSLYDVDQALGGAWTGEFNNGVWEYNEAQLDIIEDYISKNVSNDEKQNLYIGYLVNKSAIKVGAGNVNSVSAWSDNSTFNTITMKTKYGGVQMDADHELDMAEVTEMTQMISALIEDGHYKDVVESIYQDIGGVVASHIAKLSTAVKNVIDKGDAKSKQTLYEILAKSWIESFETKSKDTIGIAQAFVKKASDAFRKGNFDIKIPFSAATINGSFVADVISSINKGGIRHKYEGFAGVLNPSHNMIQYFKVFNNGEWEVRLFDEFMDFIKSRNDWNIGFDQINSIYYENLLTGTQLNPLLESVSHNNIDFEDTIVVLDENGNVVNNPYDKIEPQFWYIDSFTIYDNLKTLLRNNPNYKTYIHTGKPRNLKGANVKFTVNGNEYSIYDLDSVRASQYLTKALKDKSITTLDQNKINVIKRVLGWRFNESAIKNDISLIPSLIKLCNDKTQYILKCIEDGKSFEASEAFGFTNPVTDEYGQTIVFDRLRLETAKIGTRKSINVDDLAFKLNALNLSDNINNNIAKWLLSILENPSNLNNTPIGLSNDILKDIQTTIQLYKKADKLKLEQNRPLSEIAKAESDAQEALDQIVDKICNNIFDFQVSYILKRASNVEPIQSLMVNATDYHVDPAEIIAGRYQWEKFGLGMDDHIFNIKDSGYFYGRLQTKYNALPEYVESELFDGVLFGNDEQFLFKIGDISTDVVGQLSESTDFKVIENDVYYQGIKVGSSENKKFFTYTDETGQKHHIIQLRTTDDFNNLKKSSLFSNVIRYNWTNENLNTLKKLKYKSEDGIKIYTNPKHWELVDFDSVTLDQLKTDEDIRLEQRISNQAKDMYDSFKRQLNFVGARIPTQAMQSFMAMKLIAVSKVKENAVYVPKSQTYLEGSDYDIDKLYILAHSVNNNGLVQIGTSIQSKYGLDFVSKLSRPKNKEIEVVSDPETAVTLSQNFIERFEYNDIDQNEIIELYNGALYTGRVFVEPYTNDGLITKKVYDRVSKKIIKEINDYSHSVLTSNSDPNYLKNRVVSGIWDITNKLQNQLISQIPVDMGDPQKAAENSTLGRAELHINSDDPSAKMMMQQQNAVGKEVIGISAVSLKAFFGLYYYYSELTDNLKQACIESDVNTIANTLNKMTFIHPITGNITSLANIDIEQVIDVLREKPELKVITLPDNEVTSKLINSSFYDERSNAFNLFEFCKYLQKEVNLVDAALTDSALISAATDNAKELILAKINATPELVDIYTYLTSIGTPFLDIANLMTSEAFGFITKVGEVNVFDSSTHHRKVKKAINWFLGKDILSGFDRMIMEQALKLWSWKEDGTVGHASNEQFIGALNNRDKVIQAINNLQNYLDHPSYNSQFDSSDPESNLSWAFNGKLLGVNKIENEDIRSCIKVLEWQLRLFDFKSNVDSSEIAKIELIANLINNVEEMSTMGQAQGINQGQRTNLYSNRAFLNRINSFVNDRLKELKITDTFDFERFISEDDYRERWIQDYGKIRKTSNILEALTRLPHFWEMLKTTAVSKNAIKESSWRNKTIWDLADSIELEGAFISEDDWKSLDYYINDYIIASFLKSNNLTFRLPKGVNYYSGMSTEGKLENKVDGYEISLNTITGIASFKRFVEEYVIPYLKSNFRYANNTFIANLIPYANTNFDRVATGWKLPLDMMNIDASPNTKLLFSNILSDFDSIANQTEFGMKLGDMFYLYNLIVNKDGYGRSSLTRLFENTINSDDTNSLAYKFNDFISRLDSGDINLNLSKDEAIYRIKKANPKFNGKSALSSNFKIPSDFTLDLPTFFDFPIQTGVKVNAAEMKARTINLNTSDAVLAIAQAIAYKYDDSVSIVTDEELENESDVVRNAKAFIKNGKIFININSAKASDALHELAHLVLASMKFSDDESIRRTYYNLVTSTRDKTIVPEERFNEIAKAYVGENGLITSDVLEEVLANEFAFYLSGEFMEETKKLIDVNSENLILSAIAKVLELDKAPSLDKIQGKTLGDIMKSLGRNILMANKISSDFVSRTQKVSKIEDRLYREQKLTCK